MCVFSYIYAQVIEISDDLTHLPFIIYDYLLQDDPRSA